MVVLPSAAWDGHLQGIVLIWPACLEVICCISHCTMCPPGYCPSSLSSRSRGHPAPYLATEARDFAPCSGCCHPFCCRRAESGELEQILSGLALRPAPKESEHRLFHQQDLGKGRKAVLSHPYSSSIPRFTQVLLKLLPKEREKGCVSSETAMPSVQSSFALEWWKEWEEH